MNNLVFDYKPVPWLPFNDPEVLDKVRKINLDDIEDFSWEHEDFKVQIVPDVQSSFVIDLFNRIYESDSKDQKLTVILPNPYAAVYENIAKLCNKYGVSCRNLHVFFLNEWADHNGLIAPLDYRASYGRIFQKYFYGKWKHHLARYKLKQMVSQQ